MQIIMHFTSEVEGGYQFLFFCPSVDKMVSICLIFLHWRDPLLYLIQLFTTIEGVSCILIIHLDPYLQGYLLITLSKMEQWSHICAVTFLPLGVSFAYLVKIPSSLRKCIVYNKFRPWPIFSRSPAHNFADSMGQQNHAQSPSFHLRDPFPILYRYASLSYWCITFDLYPYLQSHLLMILAKMGQLNNHKYISWGSGRYSESTGIPFSSWYFMLWQCKQILYLTLGFHLSWVSQNCTSIYWYSIRHCYSFCSW